MLLHGSGGLEHAGVLHQTPGDLLGLDAETPQLHLVVGATGQDDLALRGPAGDVAGVVEAVPQFKGAFGKALGGQLRGVAVAPAHAHAAYVEIAVNADGKGIAPVIQNIELAVGHGAAGGDGGGMVKLLDADGHRGLRGAVLVIDTGRGIQPQPLQQVAGEGFAAADDALHPRHGLAEGFVLQKGGHTGGSGGEEACAKAPDQTCQGPGGFQLLVLGQEDGAAVQKRAGAFQQKGVKAHIADGEHRALAVNRLHGAGQVQKGLAGDLHALGRAGGAGGVDHVGKPLGAVLGRGTLHGGGKPGHINDRQKVG